MKTDYITMFRRQVLQLIAAAIIGELAVAVTVWTICPPSDNTWRTYFAFRRGLINAMIAIGSAIGFIHAMRSDIKQPFGWFGTLICDTLGLFVATRVALAIGGRASLALAFISPWNIPLATLGGVKAFQLVDAAYAVVLIPAMLWVLGVLIERATSCLMQMSNRKKKCKASEADRHMVVVCGIKHRFSRAGAAYRVKNQVNTVLQDITKSTLGESACFTARWHDPDDTVNIEVSVPSHYKGKSSSEIAFGLANGLARIDEEDSKRKLR